MTLYINIGRSLILLGTLFFTAIFFKVIFQFNVLPGFSYLSSYLMSFSGALLLAWGVLMIKSAEEKQLVQIVAEITGMMMILFAAMRIIAFFVAEQTFEFLPVIIAQIITIAESGLFLTLGVIFLTRYKN